MMKTLNALTLAGLMTIAISAPVQANTLTDTLTEVVSAQLAELSSNIKQQAKAALEKTATELFFESGSQQAEQNLTAAKNPAETDKQ